MRLGVLLLLLLQLTTAIEGTGGGGLRPASCKDKCGNITIPHPFGIGEGCYAKEYGFLLITCKDNTTNTPSAFLGAGNVEVINISLTGEIRIKGLIGFDCYDRAGKNRTNNQWFKINSGPYTFSHTRNKFFVLGCDSQVFIGGTKGVTYTGGCISYCSSASSLVGRDGSCSGVGCCETAIPRGLRTFSTDIRSFYKHAYCWDFNPCSYAFVVEEGNYTFRVSDLNDANFVKQLPIVLDWSIGEQTCEEARARPKPGMPFACRSSHSECFNSRNGIGYVCNCSQGYEGNPYLPDPDGCRDINECLLNSTICPSNGTCRNTEGSYICQCPPGTTADDPKKGPCNPLPDNKHEMVRRLKLVLGVGVGLLLLMAVGSLVCGGFQTRTITKLRRRLFEQNGGLFLQDYISSLLSNTLRIFLEEELVSATNNFEKQQIIGQGGQGIVYKGKLEDNTEVAIKRSKMVNKRHSKEFAREMAILSQINHCNIVKLVGCCLEVERPMLVYEYVQRGSLYDWIHQKKNGYPISLDTRLRIATEAAEALAHLHSYYSRPIIHGDVKTSNILLDGKCMAKVSDFGFSTLAPIGEIRQASMVQGTRGYLDPEYKRTRQLTVKSDVYSLGVVLAELLTGKKPFLYEGTKDELSLAANFVSSFMQKKLEQILDAQIIKDQDMKRLWEVAELTTQCLSKEGKDRPTMEDVVMAMHDIRGTSEEHPWLPCTQDEVESLLDGGEPSTSESYDATTRYYSMDNNATFEIEARQIRL